MDIVERIFSLLAERGIEQKDLAQTLKIHPVVVSDWKKGKSKSYKKYIVEIAEMLETTAEYLQTGEEKKSISTSKNENKPDKETLMAAFWGGDKDLSPDDMEAMWADVKNFAAFIAEKKKQEKRNND